METIQNEKRFGFGENWKNFIEKSFDQKKVELSKRHMLKFLQRNDLDSLSFLDIGCGSGLHSLAAFQLGAARVVSFDYDPKAVEATRSLCEYAGQPQNWIVMQGSVLDKSFLGTLPQCDLVYSWGVLHHTGDVWQAIRNAADRVRKGGRFYIALYSADVHIDPTPEFWLDVKQKYLGESWFKKKWMEWWYIWRFQMRYNPFVLPMILWQIIQYKKNRGMDYFTDIRDWLGGWPMEFCYDNDVIKFASEHLSLELINIATGEANTEFLFKKL